MMHIIFTGFSSHLIQLMSLMAISLKLQHDILNSMSLKQFWILSCPVLFFVSFIFSLFFWVGHFYCLLVSTCLTLAWITKMLASSTAKVFKGKNSYAVSLFIFLLLHLNIVSQSSLLLVSRGRTKFARSKIGIQVITIINNIFKQRRRSKKKKHQYHRNKER